MTTLLKGIVSHFQGDATLSPAVAGPYLDLAPENPTYPYCVLAVGAGQLKPIDAFGPRYVEPVIVKVFIYHNDSTELAETLVPALNSRFDRATFALDSGTTLGTQKLKPDTVHMAPGRVDADGKKVYYSWSSYLFRQDRAHG